MKRKVDYTDASSSVQKRQKSMSEVAEEPQQNGQNEIFTSLEFKTLLKEPETRIQALNKFCKACNSFDPKNKTSIDIVKSYISSSPDCVEILKCFGALSSTNLLGSIFRSLISILTRTADDLKGLYGKVGENICGSFIQSHLQKLYRALGLRQSPRTITLALKLLTMMIMQGKETAREIANSIDFSMQCFKDVLNQNKGKMGYEVRLAYIKFVLSFFMVDDTQTTRKMLETQGLVSAIFRGLKTDPASIVQLVLTTLKEKAIKNLAVPKTAKAHFFAGPRVLSHVASLFEWNGVSDISLSETSDSVRDYIRRLVYEFLYHSCCPFKYGINFQDKSLGIGEKSKNHVLLDFILRLVPSTSDSMLRELVVEILVACPDLLSRFMNDYRISLEPKDADICIRNFEVVKAAYEAQPDVATALTQATSSKFGSHEEKISCENLIKMTIPGIFPPNFSTHPILRHCLKSKFPEVRRKSLILMLLVLNKVKATVNFALKQDNWKNSRYSKAEAEMFVLQLHDELLKGSINVKMIIAFWKEISCENVPELKNLILQVLCILQEIFPDAVTDAKFDPTNLLYGLQTTPQNLSQDSDLSRTVDSDILILKMLSKAPHQYKWFRIPHNGESPFRRLLQVIYDFKNSRNNLYKEASVLFEKILISNNLLAAEKFGEAKFWIANLPSQVKTHNDNAVLNFLSDVCGRVVRTPIKYSEILSSYDYSTGDKAPKVGSNFWNSLPDVEIEPLKCCEDVVQNGCLEVKTEVIRHEVEEILCESTYPVSLMTVGSLDCLQSTDSFESEERSVLDLYLAGVVKSLFHSLRCAEDAIFFARVFKCVTEKISDFEIRFPKLYNLSLFSTLWIGQVSMHFVQQNDDIQGFLGTWMWRLFSKDNIKNGKLLKRVLSEFTTNDSRSFSELDVLLSQALLYFDTIWKVRNDGKIEVSGAAKELLCVVIFMLQKLDKSRTAGDVSREKAEIVTPSEQEDLHVSDLVDGAVYGSCKVQRLLLWKRFIQTPSVQQLFFEDILQESMESDFVNSDVQKLFKTGDFSLTQISTSVAAKILEVLYIESRVPIDNHTMFFISKVAQSVPTLFENLTEPKKLPSANGNYLLLDVFSKLLPHVPQKELQNVFDRVAKTLAKVRSSKVAGNFSRFLCGCIQVFLVHKPVETSHTSFKEIFGFMQSKHLKKPGKLIGFVVEYLDYFPSLAVIVPKELIDFCFEKLNTDIIKFMAKVLQYNSSFLSHWCSSEDKVLDLELEERVTIFPVVQQVLKLLVLTVEMEFSVKHLKTILKAYKPLLVSENLKYIFCILTDAGGKEFLELLLFALVKLENPAIVTSLMTSVEAAQSCSDSDVMDIVNLAQILFKLTQNFGNIPSINSRGILILLKLITTVIDKASNALMYELLLDVLKNLKQAEYLDVKEKISQTWSKFLRQTLKHHFDNPTALTCLMELLPVCYDETTSTVDQSQSDMVSVTTIRDMITSHSKFLPTFLNEGVIEKGKVSLKQVLSDLLLALTSRCDAADLLDKDLGFLLGAYSCTLSHFDQNILKIILLCEQKGVDFSGFKPFLWGKTAVSSYQARKHLGDTLWKRPGSAEILSCINLEMMETTLARFPLRRRMICADQNVMDIPYFENDDLITITASQNEILESQHPSQEVYDPCFLLPVILDLLNYENLVDCKLFVRTRVLSFLLCSLASHCPIIRSAAASCLGLYYQHTQTAWFPENNLTMFVIRCVRNSLAPNSDQDTVVAIPRISSVVANFFSTLVKLHSTPDDHMFSVLHRFLLVKPQFDLKNIPEFYVLFFSAEMESKLERTWVLNLISQGLRDMGDYHVVKKKNVFQLLMCLHDSPISDNYTRRHVFEIFQQVCTIRSAVIDLVKGNGLVSWLMEVATQQPSREGYADAIGITGKRQENTYHIIHVLLTLWKTLNVSEFVADEISEKEADGSAIEGRRGRHAALAPFRVVKQLADLAIKLIENLSGMRDFSGEDDKNSMLVATLTVLESCLMNLDERRKLANTRRKDSQDDLQDDFSDLQRDHISILLDIADALVNFSDTRAIRSLVTILTFWTPHPGHKFSTKNLDYSLWTRSLRWAFGPAYSSWCKETSWVEKKFAKFLNWLKKWLSSIESELDIDTKRLLVKCYVVICSSNSLLGRKLLECLKIVNGILYPECLSQENSEFPAALHIMQAVRTELIPKDEGLKHSV